MKVLTDKPGEAPVTKAGGLGAGIFMYLFAAGSILLLIVGFYGADTAFQQTALFAASAVCGILARIFQAASHHAEVLAELRRR
jgi:hypothetical protein